MGKDDTSTTAGSAQAVLLEEIIMALGTNYARISRKRDLITMMAIELAGHKSMDDVRAAMKKWDRMNLAELQAEVKLSWWRES